MKIRTLVIVLGVLSASACRFDNPYEYYGEDCGGDDDCGGALVCEDGRCVGPTCDADEDCKHDLLVCTAGRCVLEDQVTTGDAAQGDGSVVDGAGADSAAADGAQLDTSGLDTPPADTLLADRLQADTLLADAQVSDGAALDAGVEDGAVADATTAEGGASDAQTDGGVTVDGALQDATANDLASPGDAAAEDGRAEDGALEDARAEDGAYEDAGAMADASLPDARLPDAGLTPCSAGCPDHQPRCVSGTCMPAHCDAPEDCLVPAFDCVPTARLCAPASCVIAEDCEHPLLYCDNGVCQAHTGELFDPCIVDEALSWCAPGFNCLGLQDGQVGVCAEDCAYDAPCPSGQLCIPQGDQGGLRLGGWGICLPGCDQTLPEVFPPVPWGISCSNPDDISAGILMTLPQEMFLHSCGSSDDCGFPFVCAQTATAQLCMLLAEALVRQAAGEAQIMLANQDGHDVCPSGLVKAKDNTGGLVCLPRCREDADCGLFVPADYEPYCFRHFSSENPDTAGICSTRVWSGGCWLMEFGPSAGTLCEPDPNDPNDADGDYLDAIIDTCNITSYDFDVTGGCSGPGMCRVNSECPQKYECVGGECVLYGDRCGTAAADCEMIGMRSFQLGEPGCDFLCLPDEMYRDYFDGSFQVCRDSADCNGNDVCLGNACYPPAIGCMPGQEYYGACLPLLAPPPAPIPCAGTVDCPRKMTCSTWEHSCRFEGEDFLVSCGAGLPACPGTHNCNGGLCLPPVSQPADCFGGFLTAGGSSSCLDCGLVDGQGAIWTQPFSTDETSCPCGMAALQDSGSNTLCFGERSGCGPQDLCPQLHTCVEGRCIPDQQAGVCPLGFEEAGPACAGCVDLAASPEIWDLPCYQSGGDSCPCGMVCMPDGDYDGVCAMPARQFECWDGPLPEATWCSDRYVYLIDHGRCVDNDGDYNCGSDTDCNGGLCLYYNGRSFCSPSGLPTCSPPFDQPCDELAPTAGLCVASSLPVEGVCLPTVMLPRVMGMTSGCGLNDDFKSCGPDCLCVNSNPPDPNDPNEPTWPVELRPYDCGPGMFGVGYSCFDEMALGKVSGDAGRPCTQGQLPGRLADLDGDGTELACVPTGQPPSPRCGYDGGPDCNWDLSCQLGLCVSTDAAVTGCNSPLEAVTLKGTGLEVCRLEPQTTSCSPYSGRCTYTLGGLPAAHEGGVCVPGASTTEDLCYPRVGCHLAALGEACVDQAPIPAAALERNRCAPWGDEACALAPGGCALGACHLTGGGWGYCAAPVECNHWLECAQGEVCVGGRCQRYSSGRSDFDSCDARPYGEGIAGGISFRSTCYMKQDPRCFRRQPGDTCALISDPWEHSGESGICAFQSEGFACVGVNDFMPCGGTAGSICLDGGRQGLCTDIPGYSQPLCLH